MQYGEASTITTQGMKPKGELCGEGAPESADMAVELSLDWIIWASVSSSANGADVVASICPAPSPVSGAIPSPSAHQASQ